MGWTIDTFDGIAAHGRPSNLRVAMFEMIRAIDERQVALGSYTPYFWWVSQAPHQKQNPTFDDLEFLKSTGNKVGGSTANANKAYRNMVLIKDRILLMITAGRFVTTSGGSTKYTQASIESAIGTTLEDPISVTESRWWQSIHDALDVMIHAYSELVSANFTSSSGSASNAYSVKQTAWDNRADIGSPFGILGIPTPNAAWGLSYSGGGLFVAIVRDGASSIDFMTSAFASETILHGDVVSAEYRYTSFFHSTTMSDFEVELDGDHIHSLISESSVSPATVTLGARINKSLSIVSSEPSTVPFNPVGLVSSEVGIAVTGMNVQHDLSSYLTDQA